MVTINRCGIYKVRFRIHQELRNYFNKNEVNKSLNTKDIAEAKSKAAIILGKYEQILKVCKVLDKSQIQELVDKYIKETLEQDLIDRAVKGQGTVFCDVGFDVYNNTLALASADMAETLKGDCVEDLSNNNYRLVEDAIDELLDKNSIEVDKTSKDYRLLSYYMMLAQIQILDEASKRGRGEIHTPPEVISNRLFYSQKHINKPQPKEEVNEKKITTNKEALDSYIKFYKARCDENNTTKDQYRDVVSFLTEVFLELVSPNEDVAKTTLEDIIDIRDIIKTLPKRNIQKYRVMSVDELIDAEIDEADIISSRTLVKYMKWIKGCYAYYHSTGLIQTNPLQLIATTSGTNALDERLPLEHKEIEQLLTLTKDDKVTNNLIKVFYTSGMRLSELYKCSLKEIDGVKVYDLTDRSISLKTKSSYRLIPIHRSIDVSLLKELPTQDGFSKRVNELIRSHISDDKRKVLYSLRHSFATDLKNNRIDPNVISELMGHSHQTMTLQRYASSYDVHILKEAIETLSI